MPTKPILLDPIPPGEILMEEFMRRSGSASTLSPVPWPCPPTGISAIVNGTRAITADTALRLGKYFGTSPEILA